MARKRYTVPSFVYVFSVFLFLGMAPGPKVILFFGDSLTAGYGLATPDDAYPARVGEELTAQGVNCKIINAGLSGETSAGGLARVDWVLRQPVDVFVLELGANDGLRGLPVEETTKNLQAIIDKVHAKYPAAHIVLAGMMVPPNMGPDYSEKFKEVYPALARANKATLIPFLLQDVAGHEKLNQPDGIHPNIEGHRIVGKNVARVLKPLLK